MKYLFLILLFYLQYQCLFSQNYELTYEASFDKELMVDRLNQSEKKLKDKATLRRLLRESKPVEIKVIANSTTAYSFRKNQLKSDNTKININNSLFGKDEFYYLDFIENDFVFKKKSGSKFYNVNFQSHNYSIENEEVKVINGYKCHLAYIESEDTKIWFTKDKALNLGPKTYFGLPGLVVKVNKSDIINYDLKSIKETKIEPQSFPDNQTVISEKKYNAIIRKLGNGIFEN